MKLSGPLAALVAAAICLFGTHALAAARFHVGIVTGTELTPDATKVIVHIRLHREDTMVAKDHTVFWLLRPQISGLNISGLTTVLSGPVIEAAPGGVNTQTDFIGQDQPPPSVGEGLRLTLHTTQLDHLEHDSPVTYKGFQVGVVQDIELGDYANQLDITLLIWPRYSTLVRADSEFWSTSGAAIKGGIFSGISVKVDSLQTLVTGGIAFATPTHPHAAAVQNYAEYTLHASPEKDWTEWDPAILLPPDLGNNSGDNTQPGLKAPMKENLK